MSVESCRISPCLWFDDQAAEAAEFYTSVFPNSKILNTTHYCDAGQEVHGRPAGSVMTVDLLLDGQRFMALNGGPLFTFNEAISLRVACSTQDEVDYYWDRLRAGGAPAAQQCGWLKDRFGVSWQVVPQVLERLMSDSDVVKVQRVMHALLQMQKLDIAELESAFAGE